MLSRTQLGRDKPQYQEPVGDFGCAWQGLLLGAILLVSGVGSFGSSLHAERHIGFHGATRGHEIHAHNWLRSPG